MEGVPSSEAEPALDLSDQIAIEGLVDTLINRADERTFNVLNQIKNRVTGQS